jgi:DNA-binding transcriptional MerR regulator
LLRITLIDLDEIKKENRKIDKKVKMKEWIENGFNLDEAIEWWMWGFTPEEARCWKSVGVPGKVIKYYLKGFTPEQAREEEKKISEKMSEELKKMSEGLKKLTEGKDFLLCSGCCGGECSWGLDCYCPYLRFQWSCSCCTFLFKGGIQSSRRENSKGPCYRWPYWGTCQRKCFNFRSRGGVSG